ncbi:hypothetical protein BX616_004919 [Lobosporangium transversale]|nr:hypothetical protein BX616_004919 [Lobosporangium transversale]
MKFSIIATTVALALATTTIEAANSKVYFYSDENNTGNCRYIEVPKYDLCVSAIDFRNAKSAQYHHEDPHATGVTLTFYETANCGAKWTRAGFSTRVGLIHKWGKLDKVGGKVKSILLHKGILPNGSGYVEQYLADYPMKSYKC